MQTDVQGRVGCGAGPICIIGTLGTERRVYHLLPPSERLASSRARVFFFPSLVMIFIRLSLITASCSLTNKTLQNLKVATQSEKKNPDTLAINHTPSCHHRPHYCVSPLHVSPFSLCISNSHHRRPRGGFHYAKQNLQYTFLTSSPHVSVLDIKQSSSC